MSEVQHNRKELHFVDLGGKHSQSRNSKYQGRLHVHIQTLRLWQIIYALGRAKSPGLGMGGRRVPLQQEGCYRMLPLRHKLCWLGIGSSDCFLSLPYSQNDIWAPPTQVLLIPTIQAGGHPSRPGHQRSPLHTFWPVRDHRNQIHKSLSGKARNMGLSLWVLNVDS